MKKEEAIPAVSQLWCGIDMKTGITKTGCIELFDSLLHSAGYRYERIYLSLLETGKHLEIKIKLNKNKNHFIAQENKGMQTYQKISMQEKKNFQSSLSARDNANTTHFQAFRSLEGIQNRAWRIDGP